MNELFDFKYHIVDKKRLQEELKGKYVKFVDEHGEVIGIIINKDLFKNFEQIIDKRNKK